MLAWLFPTAADRRLLPGGTFRGPTPWVIAIMSFAMLVVAASGLALANAAGIVRTGVANRYSVQIPNGGAHLPAALAAVRSTKGVTAAAPVGEAEMRHTLEQWLGPAGGVNSLPVPALIHFDASTGTDLAALERQVAAIAPGAHVIAHRATLGPLLRSIFALQGLAWALVALMAAAMAAAVVLAARGALDTHRATIEVMHGIGATDLQVTRLFQRKIALDAVAGTLAGGAAALVVLLLLAVAGAGLAQELAGTAPLDGADVVVLLLLPVLVVALATWVARTAVLAALRRDI